MKTVEQAPFEEDRELFVDVYEQVSNKESLIPVHPILYKQQDIITIEEEE